MDRTKSRRVEHRGAVPVERSVPIGTLLRTGGRERREHRADASVGRAVYANPVLRDSANHDLVVGDARSAGQCEAGSATAPANGIGRDLSQTAVVDAGPGTPDFTPVPVSDDNPFSEAQFKTLKYRPGFPDRFGCSHGYPRRSAGTLPLGKDVHYHSGELVTGLVQHARADVVMAAWEDCARQRHPERVSTYPERSGRPTRWDQSTRRFAGGSLIVEPDVSQHLLTFTAGAAAGAVARGGDGAVLEREELESLVPPIPGAHGAERRNRCSMDGSGAVAYSGRERSCRSIPNPKR